jgi:hypothetical protein
VAHKVATMGACMSEGGMCLWPDAAPDDVWFMANLANFV